ncbi:hypothetical protein PMAYCL1PPCAC_02581, partial [Pristionchus mayeri]
KLEMPPKRSVADKSKSTDQNSVPLISASALQHNLGVLEYARTCQSAAAGMAAGVLGLTSIPGFLFYFSVVLIQALFWESKSSFDWSSYFLDRTASVSHSLVSGLFTYILFWVFLYGMVHVY